MRPGDKASLTRGITAPGFSGQPESPLLWSPQFSASPNIFVLFLAPARAPPFSRQGLEIPEWI